MQKFNRKSKAAVVVPVWNSHKWVRIAVTSLIQSRLAQDFDIYVVDDASPSHEIESLFAEFQKFNLSLHLSRNQENLGFLGTCNKIFEELRLHYDYVFLCNSDVVINSGTIECGISYFDAHSEVALLSFLATEGSNLSARLPEGFDYIELHEALKSIAHTSTVNAVTSVGHLLGIRVSSCKEGLLFDPIFGKGYGEESDLHYRLLQEGWRAEVVPNAFIYHRGEGSFGSNAEKSHVGKFWERWGKIHEKAVVIEEKQDTLTWLRIANCYDLQPIVLSELQKVRSNKYSKNRCNNLLVLNIDQCQLIDNFDKIATSICELKSQWSEVAVLLPESRKRQRQLPTKTFYFNGTHCSALERFLDEANPSEISVSTIGDFRDPQFEQQSVWIRKKATNDKQINSNPRVVVFAPDFQASGGIFVIQEFCRASAANGFTVDIVTPSGFLLKENRKYGFPCYSVEDFGATQAEFCDLVVLTWWETFFWAAGRVATGRVLWLCQSLENALYAGITGANARIQDMRSTTLYALKGHHVITVSPWLSAILDARYGIQNTLICNTLSDDIPWCKYQRIRNWESILSPADAHVLVEGTFAKHKDLQTAIEYCDTLGFASRTLLCGHIEDERDRINLKERGWKVISGIPREEVAAEMSKADILLRTSKLDSFGFAPLEMMATGGLVMVRHYQGAPGLCHDGETAICFENITDIELAFQKQQLSKGLWFKEISDRGLNLALTGTGKSEKEYKQFVSEILQCSSKPEQTSAFFLLMAALDMSRYFEEFRIIESRFQNLFQSSVPAARAFAHPVYYIKNGKEEKPENQLEKQIILRKNLLPLRYRIVDLIVLGGIKRIIPTTFYRFGKRLLARNKEILL